MVRGRMSNTIERFARDRNHMRSAEFELLGRFQTESETPRRPTENSLANLAPLRANRNFSADGSARNKR